MEKDCYNTGSRRACTEPMNRRSFLATAAAPLPLFIAQGNPQEQQYLELIIYHTHVGTRRSRVADFYRDVAIPAYERLGIGPIGVFDVLYGPTAPSVYVLVPHNSIESVLSVEGQLRSDSNYMNEGAAFLGASLSDPAYVRKERQLMRAFKDMPQLEIPSPTMGDGRIFEWRVYESHSITAGQKKIDMFNEGGEIAIFRKTGLTPVFFGETLFGPAMPNLTYMLVFDSMASRDAAWQRFIDDPDWHVLRSDPQFADTVSNISDIILRPAPFSQI